MNFRPCFHSFIRTSALAIALLTLPMVVQAGSGVPEQVGPGEQNREQVQPQPPSNPPAKEAPSNNDKRAESPLEDMWQGFLEFFYGNEPDSTVKR